MSENIKMDLPFNCFDNIQKWADTHSFFWESESDEHSTEIRDWLQENMPIADDSECILLRAYMTSLTSGVVIVEFDHSDEMTDVDIQHMQQWMHDFPVKEMTGIWKLLYCPMMGLGGIMRVEPDELDTGIDIDDHEPIASMH